MYRDIDVWMCGPQVRTLPIFLSRLSFVVPGFCSLFYLQTEQEGLGGLSFLPGTSVVFEKQRQRLQVISSFDSNYRPRSFTKAGR